jgi:hypothetical protein
VSLNPSSNLDIIHRLGSYLCFQYKTQTVDVDVQGWKVTLVIPYYKSCFIIRFVLFDSIVWLTSLSSNPRTGKPVVKAPYAVACTVRNYSDLNLACFSTNDIPCINTYLRHSSVYKCMSVI